MAVAEAQVTQLRRMVAESESSTVYTAEVLEEYIAACALPDSYGRDPDDDDWTATYDLNAAAAQIWEEKASALATSTDFSADGGSYSDSQKFQQADQRARFYRARRSAKSAKLIKWPQETRAPLEESTYVSV
jgi:hypothetical protein